ncbi:TIGR02444 family protein [Saccharobesus litoralis]|uniref:TIGR02444 family protein n=1 Tax=Saccharobesus litoralis TaxID=2172099 RepID=A0A2S0VW70_9ALTE|nr:TIGR02444 family protein [Saccharobesus litoralis]AWB68422.1 TIGR02444 family protein [Saccharobesus litoralis]
MVSDRVNITVQAYWQQSIALYQQEGVQQACLYMQDALNANVNLLLLLTLLDQQKVNANTRLIQALHHKVNHFGSEHTQPLRQLRRQLTISRNLSSTTRAQLKKQLLQSELLLEQQEQALLIESLNTLAPDLTMLAPNQSQSALVENYLTLLAEQQTNPALVQTTDGLYLQYLDCLKQLATIGSKHNEDKN